jgi:hypothetical protein
MTLEGWVPEIGPYLTLAEVIEFAFDYRGNPGLVRLDPRWHQAAWRFVQLGFQHILVSRLSEPLCGLAPVWIGAIAP